MKAILTNPINGVSVEVHSTSEHSACSYGKEVWVDDNNNAYCQVDLPSFYEIKIIEED